MNIKAWNYTCQAQPLRFVISVRAVPCKSCLLAIMPDAVICAQVSAICISVRVMRTPFSLYIRCSIDVHEPQFISVTHHMIAGLWKILNNTVCVALSSNTPSSLLFQTDRASVRTVILYFSPNIILSVMPPDLSLLCIFPAWNTPSYKLRYPLDSRCRNSCNKLLLEEQIYQ